MRLPQSLTPALLIAVLLVPVSSCASRERLIFPPNADLEVEAKPRLDPAALQSEAALDDHDNRIEGWGERGWSAVARLCKWAIDSGAKGLTCRPPDPG